MSFLVFLTMRTMFIPASRRAVIISTLFVLGPKMINMHAQEQKRREKVLQCSRSILFPLCEHAVSGQDAENQSHTDGADDGRLADCIGLGVDREVGEPLEVILDGVVVENRHLFLN